jgi:hypothetical protein
VDTQELNFFQQQLENLRVDVNKQLLSQFQQIDARLEAIDAKYQELVHDRQLLKEDFAGSKRGEQVQFEDPLRKPVFLPSASETCPQPEFHAPDKSAPVDLTTVLRNLGTEGVLSDGDAREDACSIPSELFSPRARQETALPQSCISPHQGEDDSIDDYMARLLERVRGVTEGTESAEPPARSVPLPQSSSTSSAPTVAIPVEPEAAYPSVTPSKSVQITPISNAPEKNAGLTAMRELANLSAQKALSRHSHDQLKQVQRTKLLIAIGGLAGFLLCFWLWLAVGTGVLTAFVSLIGLGIAVYWGAQYAIMAGCLEIQRGGKYGWRVVFKKKT